MRPRPHSQKAREPGCVTSLFRDGHKLECSEATSDFQFREPPMKPTENTEELTVT